jgi:mannose-6-phosphate isomerase-like protein (cupin superfamily)
MYLNILDEEYTKVKQIVIKPGESPSYQYHHKRSEIWVIVKGTAEVRLDDEIKTYGVGDVVTVPVGSKHQPKNIGEEDLVFVEIQLGEYFGEDDIVRLEDKYGRV